MKCKRRTKRILLAAAILLLAVALTFVGGAFVPNLCFFRPVHNIDAQAAIRAHIDVRPLTLQTDDATRSGFACGTATDTIVLLYCGGGEDASSTLLALLDAGGIEAFSGTTLVLFDYPSFGDSTGKASEASFYAFGLETFDWAASAYPTSRLILAGYSIGTGVATYVASQREADGLLLLAPFDTGKHVYTDGSLFMQVFCVLSPDIFPSDALAPLCAEPTLLVCGLADTVTPPAQGARLAALFPKSSVCFVSDATHGDLMQKPETVDAIRAFLAARP